MYMITAIVMAVYICLLIVSRRETIDQGVPRVYKPFYKMALFIYKRACIKKLTIFEKPEVTKDLERLNPGNYGKQLCTAYYVKKTALSLTICFAGTILGALICFYSEGSRILQKDGSVKRGDFSQEPRNIRLTTQTSGGEIFSIDVESQIPEKNEFEAICGEFIKVLGQEILGKNQSAEEVTENLNLVDSIENYPFYVEWESNRPEIISSLGSVAEVNEEQEVVLTADIVYEDMEWTEDFHVRVMPKVLSNEETEKLAIQRMLERSESESRTQALWVLPTQYQGKHLEWSEVVEDNSGLIWAGVILTAVAVFFLSDRDLHSELQKKMKKMKQEYPDIVQKFVLYMGAGLTIRGAFYKIASDYENACKHIKEKHPAYEEMLYTCRELQAGVSERAAYEHFGKRTGVQEYIRLCTLLQQNLKKGNSEILDRLREEAYRASSDKLQSSRRLGEEASTKLLIPMVLMLLVVMIMIIIPAFSSTSI